MRVFRAGASGAIGTRLVVQLIERGDEVIRTARSPAKLERMSTLRAKPIALDLLDVRAGSEAVAEAEPIVDQPALADYLLDPNAVPSTRETNAAMRYLDEAVTEAGGIALRFGNFYGASNDGLVQPLRKRQFPIVGNGGRVSSFIHLDEAAWAPSALERGNAGIYNVVDDDPAPVREWLPVLAEAVGAKPPPRACPLHDPR